MSASLSGSVSSDRNRSADSAHSSEQHRLLSGGSASPITPAAPGLASPHLRSPDNGNGGSMVAAGWKEVMAAAQDERRHGTGSWSWSGQARRWWAGCQRSTDWNAVSAWGIALFFFMLWMLSPAGRFESRNAACPVPLDFELAAWARRHEMHVRALVRSEQEELEGAGNEREATTLDASILAAPAPATAAASAVSGCPPCSSQESLPPASSSSSSSSELLDSQQQHRAWSSGLTEPLVFHAASAAPPQLSSHVGSRVRKRVHLKAGIVPHLLQWAESTFEPGDEAARHVHDSATEIFFVRSGTLSIFFDDNERSKAANSSADADSAAAAATAAAAAAPHAISMHELQAHDSVTIPPKRWHRMANLHDTTLELVYATLLTP